MEELLRFQAREQICRQCAAFEPERTWHWLAQAEMWKYKAEDYKAKDYKAKAYKDTGQDQAQEVLSSRFKGGGTTGPAAPDREAVF